jgi:hypothetical protein
MPTTNLGLVYENRTLLFYGYAYGATPVTLTATINGSTVFSGEVPTVDAPTPSGIITDQVLLFSLDNSPLFPTNISMAYPMSIAVSGGNAVMFANIQCNYISTTIIDSSAIMENSSISNTTLTVGTIQSGTIVIGQELIGNGILPSTIITEGSGTTWTVSTENSVSNITITSQKLSSVAGNASHYASCYDGVPVNSEDTPDPRSSVAIDGVLQVPPNLVSQGVWSWVVPTNSTISYNLNVAQGNCAQS